MALFYPQCKPLKKRCPFIARFTRIWMHLGRILTSLHNFGKSRQPLTILMIKGIKEVGPQGLEPWTKGL